MLLVVLNCEDSVLAPALYSHYLEANYGDIYPVFAKLYTLCKIGWDILLQGLSSNFLYVPTFSSQSSTLGVERLETCSADNTSWGGGQMSGENIFCNFV